MSTLIISTVIALVVLLGIHFRYGLREFSLRDWLCTCVTILTIWTIAFFTIGILLKTQGIYGPIQYWDVGPGSEAKVIFGVRTLLSLVLWFVGIPCVVMMVRSVNKAKLSSTVENHIIGEKFVRYISAFYILLLLAMGVGFYPTV